MTTLSDIQTSAPLIAARNAVYAAFFANGLVVGHWAPKIPVMVERLGITESTLGQMIVLLGVGALLAMIVGAWGVVRFGSRTVVRWTSVLLAPSLILITLSPTPLIAAFALLWLGMSVGAMDNAMNANGVVVETGLGKPVMSSYHGFWSLGLVTGGLTGGAMITWLGPMGHAVIVSLILLALALWAWPRYNNSDSALEQQTDEQAEPKKRRRLPRAPALYVLGVLTLLAFAPEGVVIDWSALYLNQELGAPLYVSGYAVAAFAATMAAMRFRGDALRLRFGDRATFIFSCITSAVGLTIAGMSDSLLVVCFGFLIAGIGMANLVPVLFSTAGRFPGVNPAVAIAVCTAFGYGGLMFIPPMVGLAAEHFSIGAVYVVWGGILIAMTAVGWTLPQFRTKQDVPTT